MPASSAGAMAAEVRSGTIESVDVGARTCLIMHGNTRTAYHAPASAVLIMGKRPVELGGFQPGAQVKVRCRLSDGEPLLLYDLVDAASWEWLQRLRRETTEGKVMEVGKRTLLLEDSRDHGRLSFAVTAATRISTGGAAVDVTGLAVGQTVYVTPRLLPNGSTMATAIADTRAEAQRLHERSQPTVTGTVESWDGVKRTMTLRTVAGDSRALTLVGDCIVRRNGRDVGVGAIRTGSYVTAHVRGSGSDRDLVQRVTIKTPPKARQ